MNGSKGSRYAAFNCCVVGLSAPSILRPAAAQGMVNQAQSAFTCLDRPRYPRSLHAERQLFTLLAFRATKPLCPILTIPLHAALGIVVTDSAGYDVASSGIAIAPGGHTLLNDAALVRELLAGLKAVYQSLPAPHRVRVATVLRELSLCTDNISTAPMLSDSQ